ERASRTPPPPRWRRGPFRRRTPGPLRSPASRSSRGARAPRRAREPKGRRDAARWTRAPPARARARALRAARPGKASCRPNFPRPRRASSRSSWYVPAMSRRIAFLGGGNMADALVGGLLRSGFAEVPLVTVAEPLGSRRDYLIEKHGVRATSENAAAVEGAEIVILSVKPQVMDAALDSVRDALPRSALVVSIAAGVSCGKIEGALGGAPRVVRAMPNTPALVSSGATGVARGAHATEED